MLSLEVMDPGGSLSTVLIATPYRRDASWRVSWQATTATAAYKLRQDGCGARPSAGKRLAVALAERTGFVGDGVKNFIMFRLYSASSIFSIRLLIRPFFIFISVEFVIVGQ
jgi:hypothetical protein